MIFIIITLNILRDWIQAPKLVSAGTHSHDYWLADSHQTETLLRRALLFDIVADLGCVFCFRRATVALAASQGRDTQSRLLAGRFPSNRNALPKSVVVRCRRRSGGRLFFRRVTVALAASQRRATQSRLLAGRFPSNRNALPKSVVVRCRRRSGGRCFFRRATVALAAS